MSKELQALEDIILYLNANEPKGLYCKNIEVIKAALKEHEVMKQTKLIVVDDKISDEDLELISNCRKMDTINLQPCKIVEETKKKLKAFEIIKEYFILTSEYGKVSLEPRKIIPVNKLTELKEVLK